MRVYFETYGCALNRADTSIMKQVLVRRGHEIVETLNEADVVIINTCTVRLDTELRIIKRLKELREHLSKTEKKVVIAGCMAKAQPYTLKKIFPEASLISPQNVLRVAEAVESPRPLTLLSGARPTHVLHPYVDGKAAEIPIAEGCLGNCSFCIVKVARRNLRSYPPAVVIKAMKEAVSSGAVEIDLTAQDTGAYGVDLVGAPYLPQLIRDVIDQVPGKYFIRVGMMNPDSLQKFIDEFIEVLRSPKVFKYVHLPLQSGSDKVLRVMRRKYTYDEFRTLVTELRRKIPEITIATDIIVGHPGEDEHDFELTEKAVKDLMFDKVHLAQYTPRPRTLSAAMPQVPEYVKKKRSTHLGKVVEEVGIKINSAYIGVRAKAVVTKTSFRGSPIGRLFNYKPVVLEGGDIELGEEVLVEIKDATFFDLRGSII